MGRPISKKYFLRGGNVPSDSSIAKGFYGLSASVSPQGTWYAQGTTILIAQGQLGAESTTATASLTISTTTGAITAITINNPGSGYNAAPTYTINQPATVTSTVNSAVVTASNTFTVSTTAGIQIGMLIGGGQTGYNGHVRAINGNVITSTVNNNGTWTNASNLTFSSTGSGATIGLSLAVPLDTGNLAMTAYLTTGTSAVSSEIVKQEGSRRYLVENAQGLGKVKLVTTDTLTTGTAKLIATDFGGSTYFVKKLTNRKAILVARTSTSTALITLVTDHDGVQTGVAKWTTGAATGTTVTIAAY
jgi:hypothetical protein